LEDKAMITVSMRDPYFERASHLLKPFPLLTLFYLLPEDAVTEIKLNAVPRCPFGFVADEFFTTRYFGKAFPKRLMKLWAKIMWACLDMKGWVSDYSEDDPMHKLIHDPGTWLMVLADMGYDTDWLATKSVTEMEIPYPNLEDAAERFIRLANCFWNHPNIKAAETYEVIRAHRAHEDFAFRKSNAKIDHRRSYYHTQSKIETVSYERNKFQVNQAKQVDVDFQNADIRGSWNYLCTRLKGKNDETIFKMTYLGYTQKEIAKYIGYTQGAVSKRLDYILSEFQRQRGLDNNPPPSAKPSAVKYDVIPFSYRRATA
jgi:hypothetical protein